MLFVSQQKKAERLEVCKSCEHYNRSTRSCGTLLKRKKVKGGTLCGCFMPAKASLKAEACPLKKWPALITPEDLQELRDFLGPLEKFISREQNLKLTELYNRTYHTNESPSNCESCVRNMIENLKKVAYADSGAYVWKETERVHESLATEKKDTESLQE
jgi:hypothetical protein